jgi:hypothetical protein
MKKMIFSAAVLLLTATAFTQQLKKQKLQKTAVITTTVLPGAPAELQGTWMYGNFSTTEYWSTVPNTYLGNALTFAIAFTFNADGTYEQYFTSSYVLSGITTYNQAVTKGNFKIDVAANTIITTASSSHYKRTKKGITEEERDLPAKEISPPTTYIYKKGIEPNGTEAVYLTMKGTNNPLTFLKNRF